MKHDFDVLIAGGGMVGAGCAALLGVFPSTSALRVAVLEPRPASLPAREDPLELRVSALSRASQRMLERAGAWQAVLERGASPYQRMVVWDKVGRPEADGALCFEAAGLGEPDLGHIVENRTVQAALTERAVAHGVTLLRAGVAALDLGADAATVTTTEDRRLSAALVIAADGGQSAVRKLAGIETQGWEYGQHAVVTHLRPVQPHGETAWQRFLPTGPLALLPLSDGRVSLVWSTLPERAAELVGMPDEDFATAVTEASAGVLGRLEPAAPRASFPLRLLHAIHYTRPRLALVGDAAHGVHPLAGQGVNLGFMDCAALVQCVGEALEQDADAGDRAALRRYERWRKAENLPAMILMDWLKRLFSNDDPSLSWLRSRGLGLVDRATPLKRSLMERAMGLAGDVPLPAR